MFMVCVNSSCMSDPWHVRSLACQASREAQQVCQQVCTDRQPVEVEVGPWLAQARCREVDGTGWAGCPSSTGGHIHRHNAAGNVGSCAVHCHSTTVL